MSKPKYEEIMKKFVTRPRDYYSNIAWPFGAVALCRLSYRCLYTNYFKTRHLVFRSRRRSDHAEAQLIAFLRTCRDLDGSSSIFIEVFQNLSPCNDSRNETSCAEKIIQFKRYMESLGKEVQIIITFANFYRTEPTSRNSRSRANRNVQGLQMLRDNDIELRLLTGETEWRSFLCDDQLLNLSENERCACLSQALSFDGVCREMDDKWLFQKILGFAGNRLSFRELTCNALSRAQDNLCQPQVVLACKISYYINDRLYGPECAVFRSGVECAEAKLLHYLTRLYSNVGIIYVEVVQNNFPCAERCPQGFSCVESLLRYKRGVEARGRMVSMTILHTNLPQMMRNIRERLDAQALRNEPGITIRRLTTFESIIHAYLSCG